MTRWAGGGIILSPVVSRYQLGLARQAGSVIVPPSASTPHGTCEPAMNAASAAGISGHLPTASLEWAGGVALMRDRLGAKPDELVDPDRPQRELFVSGVGGQRRGAVDDHWAGHRVVGAA